MQPNQQAKVRDLQIFNQQDALFAVALVVSLVGPLSIVVALLPYAMFWYAVKKSERLSEGDESYIRQLGGLSRHVILRKSTSGTSAISIPFRKSLYVSDDLLNRSNMKEARSILAHESGHLRNLDFFIFVIMGVSCLMYLLRSAVNLPEAFAGCSISSPYSPYLISSAEQFNQYVFSIERLLSHRNVSSFVSVLLLASVLTYLNSSGLMKKYSPIMRSTIYLSIFISVFAITYFLRGVFETIYLCDNENWNRYIGESEGSVATLRGTEFFWGILTAIICGAIIYTYGRILRRREVYADAVATASIGEDYIQFLETRALPPVWIRSAPKKRGAGKRLRALLYPSFQQRLDIQNSSAIISPGQVFIKTFLWSFAISMVCTTYFLGVITPDGMNSLILKFIPLVFGPCVIFSIGSFCNRWIIRAMSDKRRMHALSIFGALCLGLLTAQILFGVIDLSLYDRERTLVNDLTSRIWSVFAYASTVFTMGIVFLGKNRYIWLSPFIAALGLLLAIVTRIWVTELWDVFGNIAVSHAVLAATVVFPVFFLSAVIRLGDLVYLRILRLGSHQPAR